MRKVVTPQRDLFARAVDQIAEVPGLELDERDYFRDVYDHLIRISDLIDSYRDLLSGATDLYFSTVSNRQNDVMKQLTVIATIFLPLTFITGFFGQNFGFMVNHITATSTFWVLGIGSMIAPASDSSFSSAARAGFSPAEPQAGLRPQQMVTKRPAGRQQTEPVSIRNRLV